MHAAHTYHCLSLHQFEAGVEAELGELEDAGVAVDVLSSQKGSGVGEDVALSWGPAPAGDERQEADGISEIAAQGVRRSAAAGMASAGHRRNRCGYYKCSS